MSAALTPPTTPTTTHMYSVQAKPVHVNSGAAAPSKPYEASRMSRWVLPCRHSLLERVPMSNTANSTTDWSTWDQGTAHQCAALHPHHRARAARGCCPQVCRKWKNVL